VTPGQIEDTYQIQLQSTFETGVPAPVVTLDGPPNLPILAPGQSTQVMFTATNHGLIAAQDAKLQFSNDDNYVCTPLTSNIGTIPAMSSVEIPVLISNTASADSAAVTQDSSTPSPLCDAITASCIYVVSCAGKLINQVAWAILTFPGLVGVCVLEKLLLAPAASILTNGGGAGGGGAGGGTSTGPGNNVIVTLPPGGGGEYCSTPPAKPSDVQGVQASDDSSNVCATVRIQLDQTAVTTRDVFTGGLEIDNGSTTANLTGVEVNLQFVDLAGNPANDKFTIEGPDLTGLTAVDGTGVVLPGGTGLAKYTIIPDDDAAASGPTQYLLEGTLSYIDPATGAKVVIPLIGSTITVLPSPQIVLNYFLQKDVVGDDPSTPQVEPSEPFTLGLLATNLGQGTATNFTVTSAQPTIVENQKGLLINFNIISSQVGDQPSNPSLTVDLGNLAPGQSQVATWSLTSSLAGQFVDYAATFSHDDALGGLNTSDIESVAIHELVHAVQANRPGDDDLPDFLANDSQNPDGLPDTLYLSDGTVAPVSIATSAATDGPVTPDHREVQLTADQSSGWSYIQVADPGYGWKLERVVRSDGVSLLVGPDVWQTDKVFNSTTNKFDTVPLLHLLDYNGTGSYTLYYVKDISTPPTITTISPVSPDPRNAPVDSIDVTFSEAIDPSTFDNNAITLTRNGGPNLITGAVNIQAVDATDATYQISGLTGLTAADGAYTLTVSAAQVVDLGDNTGSGTASINWSNGIAPPYVKQLVLVGPSIRNTAADAIDVQLSLPIDPASFTTTALSLTRDGAVVALPSGVTVSATDGTGTDFEIQGLSAATTPDGTYGLTVDASGLREIPDNNFILIRDLGSP